MLATFREMFRTHREEATETIAELVRRVVDGDTIPPEIIFKAAQSAGMTGEDVDAMAERMRHRDELRAVAAALPGTEAEIEKLAEAIAKHDRVLQEAQQRHAAATEPLRDQLTEAEARAHNSRQADAELLNPRWMEPAVAERLKNAEAEYAAAAANVDALTREHHEQTRRGEEAERLLVSMSENPHKLEKRWRDETVRHLIPNGVERVFLDWLRGNRRGKEAAEKLPEARKAVEAAKQLVEDIQAEARAC